MSAKRFVIVAILTTSLFALSVPDRSSGETIWIAPQGDWLDGPNWDTGNPPPAGDDVVIDNGGIVDVSGLILATVDEVDVNGSSILAIVGGTLTFDRMSLGAGTAATVNHDGGIVEGLSELNIEGSGTYNLNGGNLTIHDELRNRGALNINGGNLSVGSELRVFGTGNLSVASGATITVGSDLRLDNNSTITFNLTGDSEPVIQVGDELRLIGDNVTLEVNLNNWTGGQTVTLFNVGGQIRGSFADVFVDGQLLDPSQVAITSSSIVITHMPEPEAFSLAVAMLIGLPALVRRARWPKA
jgi:hypothetical protein